VREAAPRLHGLDLLTLHERHPERYPVLLESVSGGQPLGRFDLLLALPGATLTLNATGGLGGDAPHGSGRFLDALDAWWSRERTAAPPAGSPFTSGWFLYLGYELAGEVEPSLALPRSRHPRAIAQRMHGAVVRERATGRVQIVGEPGCIDALSRQVQVDAAAQPANAGRHGAARRLITNDILEQPPHIFLDGVRSALEAIARGDVYQANLSRPWRATLAPSVTPPDLYRALRQANPAPFAGIARLGDFAVLSSSPERLLRIDGDTVSTRPIAGTRPRGSDAAADAVLVRELQLNEKERAEHVMLVDLERNDLGRICRAGTVRVDEYMTIETYATVHHIVSNVCGLLRDGVTPGQAIAAVFPGGTITGCPKVRCMQLLAEFERTPRDAYTGSMGYLGTDGSLDLNILIRTLMVHGSEIEFRTGAGIVADSQPDAELAETRAKARGMLRALGGES
jgi:anthranilate synthase component 1